MASPPGLRRRWCWREERGASGWTPPCRPRRAQAGLGVSRVGATAAAARLQQQQLGGLKAERILERNADGSSGLDPTFSPTSKSKPEDATAPAEGERKGKAAFSFSQRPAIESKSSPRPSLALAWLRLRASGGAVAGARSEAPPAGHLRRTVLRSSAPALDRRSSDLPAHLFGAVSSLSSAAIRPPKPWAPSWLSHK